MSWHIDQCIKKCIVRLRKMKLPFVRFPNNFVRYIHREMVLYSDFDNIFKFSTFAFSCLNSKYRVINLIIAQRDRYIPNGVKNTFHLLTDVVFCFPFQWKSKLLVRGRVFYENFPGRRISADNCLSVWTWILSTNCV